MLFNQDVKTISDMDANQIFHLTRKNSHPHSLANENQKNIGAVLLSAEDCGNFEFLDRHQFDNIRMQIRVTDFLNKHESVTGTVTGEEDLLFRVCFIYNDYGLEGVAHEAKFWWRT